VFIKNKFNIEGKRVINMELYEILQKNSKIWDFFSRKEEYNSSIYDKYGRFPYYASSDRNIFEPRVSKYLIEHGYHAEYPEDKPFAVCLTHDIDLLYKSTGMKGLEALGNLPNSSFSGREFLAQIRSKKVPWWTFSEILALEDRYNAKSSFYFMVENPGNQDFNYPIEDCESIMGEISDGGREIGLHGGHTAYKDPVEMKEKKHLLEKILNKNISGYRNHYLRFLVPDTWEHLHNAGFSYDSTLGYAGCIGFRNGMCHPFKPYNLNTQCGIDILEIPLNIMDNTLDKNMQLDIGMSWKMTKRLIDTVERYHGVITFLWHNTSFVGEQKKFYEKILRYCNEKNAWITSGEEITNWMKKID
jgi:peptidoglycan/xylan/chitin deacetylase (PgdA/CDA1 family)